MIKVAQVFGSLDAGGAESRMVDVFSVINRSQYEFIFISLDSKDKQFYESKIYSLGGRIIKLPSPRSESIFKHIWRLLRLFRQLKTEGLTVVHAHTSYHCGVVLMAAKMAGIPIRISHARTTSSINKGSFSSRCMIFIGRSLIKLFATAKCALNEETACALYGRKCYERGETIIVQNAIDLEKFREPIICAELSDLQSDTTVICHIGRFQPMKNHEFILNFFNRYHDENKNSKLVLVGDGPLKDTITAHAINLGIKNDVMFLGLRSDIPSILARTDLFIFPSIFEGLGGSVIEAQASGIPALISDSIPHNVDMGLELVHFLNLDAPLEAWIEQAKKMLSRPKKSFQDINNAFSSRNFTLANEIKQLTDIYENAHNNNNNI